MRRNENLKGKGRADSNIAMLMGDVPLCLRSFDEENRGSSSNKKNDKERMTSGCSVLNSMMSDSRSKMTSGSKDSCGNFTEQKKPKKWKSKKQRHHSHCTTKEHEIKTLK